MLEFEHTGHGGTHGLDYGLLRTDRLEWSLIPRR
jgi:hypothetical protein